MDLFNLTGKTALVTGASSGLGEQFARCLSKAGARVILAARRINKLDALAQELGNAVAVQMDVSDKVSVSSCFSALEKAGEKIDICVNNAGIFKETPVLQQDQNNYFEQVMQINVMGVWYVTQHVSQYMQTHGLHGSIINISSINGTNYLKPNRAAYCASKAAVIQMTKSLVAELSPHQIRINCIIPGPFHTPATAYKIASSQLKEELERTIPLGFFADPREMDGLILYLASNEASRYVTGSCITIDGGVSSGFI